jgi:hypothetical protein
LQRTRPATILPSALLFAWAAPLKRRSVSRHRDMQIRYSAPDSLEISASEHELHRIARDLTSGRDAEHPSSPDVAPEPYDAALSSLRISPATGPAQVAVSDGTVIVTGSPDTLQAMASFFVAAAESGHAHFEWFVGNSFVAETSIPLVISLGEPGDG